MWDVSAHRMFVTGLWYLLFHIEPICQTQSMVELRFSSVKIKQLHRFGRFYLLRVSTSKRSPKRMQLSLIAGIAFGFWLISDLRFPDDPDFRISGSVFPGFNISGLRVNLHSRLNRWFIRGCLWNLNLLVQNETCLVDFLILEKTFTSERLFYRAI